MQRPGLGDLAGRGAALGLTSDVELGGRNTKLCRNSAEQLRKSQALSLESATPRPTRTLPVPCCTDGMSTVGYSKFGQPRVSHKSTRGVTSWGARYGSGGCNQPSEAGSGRGVRWRRTRTARPSALFAG